VGNYRFSLRFAKGMKMKSKYSQYLNILVIIFTLFGLIFFPINAKAALLIMGVSPNTISNQQSNTITVTGIEFVMGAVVSLDSFGSLNTSFFSNTTLLAVVPSGIPIGIYTVTVTNPDSSSASLPNSLSVVQVAPTVAITQTTEPPTSYERPVVVVESYSMSQEKISPGNNFTLYVTFYNAGQHYAKNIVANFIPGDLIPRETGGVVAVGEIAPGNHTDFGQPLIVSTDVWGTLASINMLVTYVDETGIMYNETFVITLPVYQSYSSSVTATPTYTLTPTPSVKPQLVIINYSTDITPLQPGIQFNLSMDVKNMGNSAAKGVTMIVGGGSNSTGGDTGTQQPGGISGGSGEFTNFAPIGSSNVQTLGEFQPGSSLKVDQTLIVNTSTSPGAYPLKISFVYNDEQNHSYIDDQVITLLVYRLPILDISFYQQVLPIFVGESSLLPIQVVNLGRNSVVLGIMQVTADSGQFLNNSILVGTLEPGGYFTVDANYIPEQPGFVNLVVNIDYTNDFNQAEIITETLSIEVMEQPIIEPAPDEVADGNGENIAAQSETLIQKIWRFILGLFGLDSSFSETHPSISDQPLETAFPEEQQNIIPVQPPLKGP
jgi:hypothetical protein